jgi:uncharacterized repeat protein (TIGR01451 family)
MASRIGWQVPLTALLVAAFAAVLLSAPAADTAPGDTADLAVTKTDAPDPVLVGSPLTYTIQVSNLGPQEASGVTLTDRLPSHADLVSVTPSQGTCQEKGGRVICALGGMDADPVVGGDHSVRVLIVVRPTKARSLSNTASVESAENDPVRANDSATATTTVLGPGEAPSCRGVTATRVGTPAGERIVGTTGPDVIVARGGPDRILGRSGRDLICANGGDDNVIAGTAADRVFGGGGADRLKGRGGPDLLAGNRGRDILKGNAGNDRLRGNRGFDRCYGGAGRDSERGCER